MIETLFRPQTLTTLGEVTIILKVWKEGNTFEDIIFKIPSYYTVEDIKREYYMMSPDASRLSRFVFIGKQTTQGYDAIDYTWLNSNATVMTLQSPVKTVLTRPDNRWVTPDGEPMQFTLNRRERLLIEDLFDKDIDWESEEMPTITLYVFQLTRLLRAYTGIRPISSKDWYTRFGPFFPKVGSADEPNEKDVEEASYINTFITKRRERVDNIERIISEDVLIPYDFTLKGIQRIRLLWNTIPDFKGCELFFYETDVTHERPFMRMLAATGQPINKIFTKGQLPIPDIADPELLRQWAREQSPDPGADYVFTKNLLREQKEGLRAVYGTMRIFKEGSADYIIVPPKKERILQATLDLADFNDKIAKVVEGTPFNPEEAKLGDASLIFSMSIPLEEPKITVKSLSKKMPCFSPFFQLIKPYVSDMPQIMLRYKMVSDFIEEGSIATYISFLAESKRARGELYNPYELVPRISEEFQLSRSEAIKEIEDWKNNRSSFIVASEDDIYEGNNAGIDIAIYEQHPQYYFHILGVDRPKHLSRIVTLLQALFLVPQEEFKCTGVKEFEKAQTALTKHETAAEPAEEIEATEAPAMEAENADLNQYMNLDGDGEFNALMFQEAEDEEAPSPTIKPDIHVLRKEYTEAINVPAEQSHHKEEEEESEENIKEGVMSRDAPILHEFFINLLKKNDPALFDFKRLPQQKPYSRRCAANVFAQPLVLTYEQFMKNYNTYINDEDVAFIIYPYKTKPIIPDGMEEYTFLRYGTNPKKDLFYTCPQTYCVRDNLIIRPRDFESTKDRQGMPKPKYSCPFCHGLPIEDATRGIPNHTVIVRKGKASERNKIYSYVGFMKTEDHPEGFSLPCCFLVAPDKSATSAKEMTITNPKFSKQREWLKRGIWSRIDGLDTEEEAEAEEDTDSIADSYTVTSSIAEEKFRSYLILFSSLHLQYIQNPEKTLIQGNIGLLPASIEAYFAQDNKLLAKAVKGRQSLLPISEGFLRVGVGNLARYKRDSLLLALVPILGRNSLKDVKQYIIDKVTPYFFIQLNYGNLVHEFFDPSYPIPQGGEEEMLSWASLHLNMDRRSENRAAAFRFWKAYHKFRDHVDSEHETKELRVFGQILSYPLLTSNTSNGLLIVVIEYDLADPTKPVQVLCPSYGITPHAKDVADICFIAKTKEGFYEPIIYTKNRLPTATTYAQHLYTLKWQRAEQSTWPSIVKQRILEFSNQCEGPGRTLYPSQEIDTYSLIGMQSLYEIALKYFPTLLRGIVRESYNHVAAILFSPRQDSESYVAVPCVDDGHLVYHRLHVALDWNGYTAASINDCIDFYNTYILPNFSLYKGYQIVRGMKPDGGDIIAARLSNGLKIPCSPATGPINVPVQTGKIELQWVQDNIIAYGESILPKAAININTINELYEYFRISFSTWLVREEQEESRRSIKNILENTSLETWEKWKRLDILLRSTLIKWLDDEDYQNPEFPMLRKDCISITDAGQCTGICKWIGSTANEYTEEESESGKCRIHIPEKFKKNTNTQLSVAELFMFRLYDDLIRFSDKRDSIFNQRISKLRIPTEAIMLDNQWILPESSSHWTELLRLDWAREKAEMPLYYEEISASDEEKKLIEAKYKSSALDRIRPDLINFLGEGAANLYIWNPPMTDENIKQPYLPLLPIIGSAYEAGLSPDALNLTEEVVKKLAEQKNKSIIIVSPAKNRIIIGRPVGYTIRDIYKGFILIIEEEGKLPSIVVASRASPVLQEDQLPKTIRDDNRKRTPRPLIRKL